MIKNRWFVERLVWVLYNTKGKKSFVNINAVSVFRSPELRFQCCCLWWIIRIVTFILKIWTCFLCFTNIILSKVWDVQMQNRNTWKAAEEAERMGNGFMIITSWPTRKLRSKEECLLVGRRCCWLGSLKTELWKRSHATALGTHTLYFRTMRKPLIIIWSTWPSLES